MRCLVLVLYLLFGFPGDVYAANPAYSPETVAGEVNQTGMPKDWFKCDSVRDCIIIYLNCESYSVNTNHVADAKAFYCVKNPLCSKSCAELKSMQAHCEFGYCVQFPIINP
jgi:hypothetical protein